MPARSAAPHAPSIYRWEHGPILQAGGGGSAAPCTRSAVSSGNTRAEHAAEHRLQCQWLQWLAGARSTQATNAAVGAGWPHVCPRPQLAAAATSAPGGVDPQQRPGCSPQRSGPAPASSKHVLTLEIAGCRVGWVGQSGWQRSAMPQPADPACKARQCAIAGCPVPRAGADGAGARGSGRQVQVRHTALQAGLRQWPAGPLQRRHLIRLTCHGAGQRQAAHCQEQLAHDRRPLRCAANPIYQQSRGTHGV